MNPAPGVTGVNPRSNAEIDRYNEIAQGVMDACGVPVVDLNAKMADWGSDCFTDLCHLTQEAFARLGRLVAAELLQYLRQ
jgi:lysophospholipase L1-like esterase